MATEHADYPHLPGTLYDCLVCESECFCDSGYDCISCAPDISEGDES